MTTQAVTALEVTDEAFLIASLIERCPKTMMIRELLMNALEAAKLAPEDQREVEFSAYEMDGASKLCIWNTGTGMDATELMQYSFFVREREKSNWKFRYGRKGGVTTFQSKGNEVSFVQEWNCS